MFEQRDIEEAVKALQQGGVILYPTDTIWGIGCDASNAQAVKRIYEIKQRNDSKAMLVLVESESWLNKYVDIPPIAKTLLEQRKGKRDAKPLTIIYPNAHNLADNLIAEDNSLGIRITEEAFSKALCHELGKPIVSTSANISGHPSATYFDNIEADIINAVDYVCEYRKDDKTAHLPSSIIKVNINNTYQVIRN